MSAKVKIKKGDQVRVIAGDERGQEGKVLSVNLKSLRAVVEGVNLVSKHAKPNAKQPNGGIVKQEASIHISNLMLVDAKAGKPTRIGRKLDEKTKKVVRYSKVSGEIVK